MKDPDIILEHPDFVVINKEAGMLSIPDRFRKELPSLYQILGRKYGKIFIVHRLDRDTSGLILFARNEESHRYLSGLFEKRAIQKTYLGIVQGSLQEAEGTISAPLAEHPTKKGTMVVHAKGKPSVTNFLMVEDFGVYSLVQFRIESGRTHQIRVHAKQLGHPVAADPIYGDGKPVLLSSFKKKFRLSKDDLEERPILSRPGLHAFQLKFSDKEGKEISLEAPLPKDMKALLNQLRKRR